MLIASSLFVSCSEDNNSAEKTNIQEESNTTNVQKTVTAHEEFTPEQLEAYKVHYDINGGEATREAASLQLHELFAETIFLAPSETEDEIIGYVFSDDMVEGIVSFESIEIFRPSLMNEQQKSFFYAFGGNEETTMKTAAKGYYTATCDGGKNDGKTMEFNGVSNRDEAKALGAKLQKFTSDCSKGGGCVNICKTSAVIKKN